MASYCLSPENEASLSQIRCAKTVVKILNIQELKQCIDKQIGAEGAMDACEYTSGPNRKHFLKSDTDAWQEEFRIFWQGLSERSVILPDGIGELVQL
jgi:hypothetical protein